MEKPYLIAVTGRPGSGKTTFAKALASEIFMPVISRDEIKEGYVHTFGLKHDMLPPDANKTATNLFFDTLYGLVCGGVSVIAEAAFQHKLWAENLDRFLEKARVSLIILDVDGKAALDRFISRGLNNPKREYFHGDKGVDMARRGEELSVSPYNEPRIDVPTFRVNTSGEYDPPIKCLCEQILNNYR